MCERARRVTERGSEQTAEEHKMKKSTNIKSRNIIAFTGDGVQTLTRHVADSSLRFTRQEENLLAFGEWRVLISDPGIV